MSCADAMAQMHQQVFEGRRLIVQPARQREPTFSKRYGQGASATPSKTLFIGNMSFEMTDRDLNNLFKNVRNVLDVRVAIDRRTGQPRGFAHADFMDVQSATDALDSLRDKELYGRKLRCDYTTSVPRSPKKDDVPE